VRTIRKLPPPTKLTQWRLPRMLADHPPGMECDYESLRKASDVREAVEDHLFAEQGGICAYTGRQLYLTPADQNSGAKRDIDFHIEHLTPQKHCVYGQSADYANMVACWPGPNCRVEPAYGARKKGDWPPPAEQATFLSPLRQDCSLRFKFNHRGEIASARNNDIAAEITIEKLGLDHHTLTELRRKAIQGALNPRSRLIKLTEARKLLAQMERATVQLNAGGRAKLMPFCFAIEPALQREIRKLEGIMNLH
jgi:uncharacterized protein (TIGR02646 family)